MIQIIGCDRTGTHMIADILATHPDTLVTIEEYPIFSYAWAIAYNRDKIEFLKPKLFASYRQKLANGKMYIDKSHMNLWIVEDILEAFPDTKFIATDRNPYATVNSMSHHDTCSIDMKWRWMQCTIPNGFLGIRDFDNYARMNIWERAMRRWKEHHDFIFALRSEYPEKIFIAQYERFIDDLERSSRELFEFLGLKPMKVDYEIKKESRDKWKKQLSKKTQEKLAEMLNGNA